MSLKMSREIASQLSGGTSSSVIKNLIMNCLQFEQSKGSLLDFGAGKGELLKALFTSGRFQSLAGTDLFPRPSHLDSSIEWYQQDLNNPILTNRQFDVVVSSETIEHLENPRHTFRSLDKLL